MVSVGVGSGVGLAVGVNVRVGVRVFFGVVVFVVVGVSVDPNNSPGPHATSSPVVRTAERAEFSLVVSWPSSTFSTPCHKIGHPGITSSISFINRIVSFNTTTTRW